MKLTLQVGDVFAVNSGSPISQLINKVSGFNSADGVSTFNHAGIITDDGVIPATDILQTFEALRKLDLYDLQKYRGREIIIARPNAELSVRRHAILRLIQKHRGQSYPWWRIPLHLYPPLARKLSYKGKYLVCSELVAKYELYLGIRNLDFTGTTPDKLAEEWEHWRDFEVIYQGKLP